MEIERKFLVLDTSYRDTAQPVRIVQGYLNSAKERTVRVRIKGERAWLTIKSITVGISRQEFEYPIPLEDANDLLALCEQPILEKLRYELDADGNSWEIDEFLGLNEGLIVAEIELASHDQVIKLPSWIGREVSDDPRYFNSNLIKHPFSEWP